MKRLTHLFAALFLWALSAFVAPQSAYAFEGDCEAGFIAKAIIAPSPSIYGGGAEFYFGYEVLDGLAFHAAAGFYAANNSKIGTFGLYNVRIGAMYALDIIEWVPAIGIHFSELMTESDKVTWNEGYNGWAIDFDAQVEYRGIRHVGLGLHFTYHLVFTKDDYMTLGLSVSWHDDSF